MKRAKVMRPEYDFNGGVRGKHAGKRLRILGDATRAKGSLGSAKTRNGNTLVGTAGEYYVCAELCRIGYLALLTPKNNPLFDVVATNIDGTASVSIQVKTRSVANNQGWKISRLPDESETPGDPFIVLVNLQATGSPDFYIYRFSEFASRVSEEFNNYISKPKKNGEPRKDPGFRAFDEKHFRDTDHARKNNWDPIILALSKDNLSQPIKTRDARNL
ncbi:MAG TPA: hypothetical protein VHQ64_19480 [Pyrinomonadaceae bacterium]|jgi:hypothetical protein|nr:hypothetical protein [Pyrinomonadaceae bacterium]